MYTEELANVVVSAFWGTELIHFLIQYLEDFQNRMISSQNRSISYLNRMISSQNRSISNLNRMISSYSSSWCQIAIARKGIVSILSSDDLCLLFCINPHSMIQKFEFPTSTCVENRTPGHLHRKQQSPLTTRRSKSTTQLYECLTNLVLYRFILILYTGEPCHLAVYVQQKKNQFIVYQTYLRLGMSQKVVFWPKSCALYSSGTLLYF